MGHDARYDRADEFMEVVLGHWNTWEDDALILDKANSRFADPAKVHRLDHGPVLPVARPVQRAAVAAGPSGADPGRAVRPGPSVRRKMGRNRIRDPSLARGRQEGVCLVQSGRRGRRARSRPRPCSAGLLCLCRRNRNGGAGKTRGHRGDGAGCGCTGPALGSAESSMPGAYDEWCGCWCPSCNAAVCSKRTMSARHCATIWDWRYPGPPIGTRRAERLCDDKLCRCAILRHTHRVPSI